MDIAQIETNLASLFARQGGLRRQLVFWYDPEREFEETFEELSLNGIRKVKLNDTPFAVKYRVLIQEPDASFLLYAPFAEPKPQENWLLDLQKQAELFSADRPTMLWKQLGLFDRSLQTYLREHLAFFNSKKRLEALNEIGVAAQSSELDLKLAMMCAVSGLKVTDPTLLLRALLSSGLSEADNPLWLELVKFFKSEEIWEVARHTVGFQPESPSLRELFIRLAVTHLQHDLKGSLPTGLQSKAIRPGTKAYVFVDNWIRHSTDANAWAELSDRLAPDLGITELAASLHPSAYTKVETFRAFDQALIRTVTQDLVDGQANPASIKDWLSARRALYWFGTYAPYYQALEAAAHFSESLSEFNTTVGGTPSEMFKAYAQRHHSVDGHYRHYITASDETSSDVLKALTDSIERRYTYEYLEPLGSTWSEALKALDGEWNLTGVEKQWRFFTYHVGEILEGSDRDKVYVIISDALRFELASELKTSLMTDLRGEATLTPLQGVLPSITKLGMAALLPGEALTVTDKGDVLVDGLSSHGTENRNTILNTSGFPSLAVHASDLLAMSRDEGRKLVQPHRLITIYQNHIDAVGDKAASERGVFTACQRALDELTVLIRKIANTLNGTTILVTSDHGFLYQRQPLAQHDKIETPNGNLLDTGRRHALGEGLSEPEGSQTFTLPYLRPGGLQAQSPWGTLRYRLQGAGAQYVHGGASLQEVCVPLLTYKHVRASKGDEGASRKVGVRVSATSRKITNNTFTICLIQDEPVSGRVRPRQVTVKFVDDGGNRITNDYPLNLDSSAPQATDREYIARLSIGVSNPDRNKPYYLVVTDTEDDLEVLRETWQVSLAFTDDFGDFG